jgi:RNase adaptor protein for sRNA GlmZ degradation
MASKELTTVMEELTRQGALNRREHLLNRREHRLNRRAYEEGMAVCAQLVESNAALVDTTVQAFRELSREIADELRAQREAVFKVIDRMDRLDGGTSLG